jgi:hypothetical protein
MKISVYGHGFYYEVEVSPSDTIWTLKCVIREESLKRASERPPQRPTWKSSRRPFLPPPDDQTLILVSSGRELSHCDETMSSCDIQEGSNVRCEWKWGKHHEEKHFRKLVDVFQKVERKSLKLNFFIQKISVCGKHACSHMHEVRALDLMGKSVFIVHSTCLVIFTFRFISKIWCVHCHCLCVGLDE